ncbi:11768_t:CDS:1 [Funneliformis geosporum]|uniref:718_t:CDS:1 n=1 Tax=Funneliformis geosporum TaxID=1117311 RepID=A0A9W4SD90_9GLOM|nr:11768_t:CDS:1 [Funneliformis geosporum]CAI2164241.1 718_t:CDS:1 [Funneliformis geosporum]
MSQQPSILVNNKRRNLMGSMFLPAPPPPFFESKEQENFKLCKVNPNNGAYLPPTPNEKSGHEEWHDNNQDDGYFSFPATYLAESRSKHSTHAFARLETTEENNGPFIQDTTVNLPKTTSHDNNLVLQLEDATIPPISPSLSCSTSSSTSEESDIDDLNQHNRHPVSQKRLTRDFDSYVSEFIQHSGYTMKGTKKPNSPSIFKNIF